MERRAGISGVHKQLGNGIDRYIGHAGDRPHGRTLAKHREDLDAGFKGQLVHAPNIMNLMLECQAQSSV